MLKSSLNITNTVNENVIMSKAIINNHESHSKKKVYIYMFMKIINIVIIIIIC